MDVHNRGSRKAADGGLEHSTCNTAQHSTENSDGTVGKAWACVLALLARKERTKKSLLGSNCEPDNRKA